MLPIPFFAVIFLLPEETGEAIADGTVARVAKLVLTPFLPPNTAVKKFVVAAEGRGLLQMAIKKIEEKCRFDTGSTQMIASIRGFGPGLTHHGDMVGGKPITFQDFLSRRCQIEFLTVEKITMGRRTGKIGDGK